MPALCPICKDPMVNTFEPIWEVLHKNCQNKLNHKIEFIATLPNNDRVGTIRLKINQYTMAVWNVEQKSFLIESDKASSVELPYFEPNLSSYHKLMEKIKTYLVFS